MVQVPKNKKIYVGRHRFIEGDIIPPHLVVEAPPVIKANPRKRTRTRVEPIPEPIFAEDNEA